MELPSPRLRTGSRKAFALRGPGESSPRDGQRRYGYRLPNRGGMGGEIVRIGVPGGKSSGGPDGACGWETAWGPGRARRSMKPPELPSQLPLLHRDTEPEVRAPGLRMGRGRDIFQHMDRNGCEL